MLIKPVQKTNRWLKAINCSRTGRVDTWIHTHLWYRANRTLPKQRCKLATEPIETHTKLRMDASNYMCLSSDDMLWILKPSIKYVPIKRLTTGSWCFTPPIRALTWLIHSSSKRLIWEIQTQRSESINSHDWQEYDRDRICDELVVVIYSLFLGSRHINLSIDDLDELWQPN